MKYVSVDNESYMVSEPSIANKGISRTPKSQRVCGVSKQLIEEGESILIVSSNYRSFPDKLVLTNAYNKLGPEESIRKIKKSYDEYRAIKDKINKEYFEWELD